MTLPELVRAKLEYAYAYFEEGDRAKYHIEKKWLKSIKSVPLVGNEITHVNWYSTEFIIQKITHDEGEFILICICGSNDFYDWVHNVNMVSYDGFKVSGYWSALRVKKVYDMIDMRLRTGIPILMGTHSKSGAAGWPLYQMLKKDGVPIEYIHAFSPAKGLRKRMAIRRATLYIDQNDIVPKLGATLRHPECQIIYHPEKDSPGIDFKDHSLKHWDGIFIG